MSDTALADVAEVTVIDNATGKQLDNATLEHAERDGGVLVVRLNTAIR